MATDQTWWALTETPKMKMGTKAVLCAMAIVSSEKNGRCYFWQRPEKLADYLGCSRSTVYHHINLLRTLNLIEPTAQGYLLCIQNPESPVQNPDKPVQNPEKSVQNPESPVQNPDKSVQNPDKSVQNPESPVQNPDTYIERKDKEIYKEFMSRHPQPELVDQNLLREKAKMIGIDPAFADSWWYRWHANGAFWIDNDMSKPLKPMGCKLDVLANRLKAKWEEERSNWQASKKRGARSTWELQKQKENLDELIKNHPGNPKNEGALGADQNTINEFRKLRNKREELTILLANVNE